MVNFVLLSSHYRGDWIVRIFLHIVFEPASGLGPFLEAQRRRCRFGGAARKIRLRVGGDEAWLRLPRKRRSGERHNSGGDERAADSHPGPG